MKLLYFVLICLIAISDNAISSNTENLSETKKEPSFEGAKQRKLEGDDNYIIIYFNKEVSYSQFKHSERSTVSKIMLNNEEKNLEDQLTIPLGSGLEVYFSGVINSFGQFFYKSVDSNVQYIISVDFSNFNSSNLQDTTYLFYYCSSLKSIDFSNSDFSKLRNIDCMFQNLKLLESVTFPENLPNLKSARNTFSGCSSLKSIDFSNCNLTSLTFIKEMFHSCISLESVSFPDSLTNVEDMQSIFSGCSSLKSIDLSNIDLSKTSYINNMFDSCSKLESVIFPKSGSQSLSNIGEIFKGCSSLTSIDLSMFTLSDNTRMKGFINACDSLVAIDFPIFNLKANEFINRYESFEEVFHFKYLNISGFSGESSDYVQLFSALSIHGLTSLAVYGSDKEIIHSARALLREQGLEMDLEFCLNYTECRLTKDPNYIIVNFNKEYTYPNGFENDYRPNIFSVILDGEEKEKNEQLDVKKGSKMIIHFTAPITDFSNFFSSQYDANVKNIISIDFSNFNSSLLDKFSSSFKGCTSLQSLDLSSFKVTSETDISNMIEDCSSLVTIDISNFDLSNNEINKIFKNIGKLLYVNLVNCLGKTNDIYTFLNSIRGVNNDKKLICLNEDKFNDVNNQYKESNNGVSIENVFERCCNIDFENAVCGYLLVSFKNEFSYENGFENGYRVDVNKIILDGVQKSKNDQLEIKAGSKMKIYFSLTPSNFSNFFDVQHDPNVVNIDSVDFSHMDLTKVIDMSYLFQGCSSLESITFSKYTPENLNNMVGMFSGCSGIKSIDLSNFILSEKTNIFGMFIGCDNLTAIDFPEIAYFDKSKMFALFGVIFSPGRPTSTPPNPQLQLKYINLYPFEELDSELLGNIIYSFINVYTYIKKLFICLNEQEYSAIITSINNVISMYAAYGMPPPNVNFERCCDYNLDTAECELSPTNITVNSQEIKSSNDLIDSDNYIAAYFNGNISYNNFLNRYRTNVTKIAVNGEKLNIEDSFTIQSSEGLKIYFGEPVESLEHFFDSITDENAVSISSIDFSHFDSSKLSNMNSIFSGCTDLVTVDFTNFNWANIQDIGYMFYACDSFKSIDLSNFDISKITNMERAFQSCDSLETVIFPESSQQNVQNMKYMFYYCKALKSIDLSKFSLSTITDMSGMFEGCVSLESVTFPEGLQKVEDMSYMFSECSSLKSLDLSNTDLTKVINMGGMFENCAALESIAFPVSGPKNIEDMSNTFSGCSSLKSINLSNFNLSLTSNMEKMFQSCSKLESVAFPESGPQSLQSMSSIIDGCSSLTSIDFSKFKILESTTIDSFIAACDSLATIDFPIFDLKTYNFTDKLGPIQGGLHFKYINLLGSTGTNENFADLFKQLYNNFNLTSLSVCVNDEEIIESAQSDANLANMELKYCCDYPICKIIETTHILSTSILDEIEIMTTTEFYINQPESSSFVDEIEPMSSSGLIDEIKTTNYEDNALISTSVAENKELESTNLDGIEPTTFNNEISEIQSTSMDYNEYESTSNIQKDEPKSTYYEKKDDIEPQSSYIEHILEKSTFIENAVTASTNIAKEETEEPAIATTEAIETKESDSEELQPKSSNEEDTEITDSDKPKSTIIKEVEQESTIIEGKEPKSTIIEEKETKSTIIEEKEPKSTIIEEVEQKSTIKEEDEQKSTIKEEDEPKSTIIEEKEPKSTIIEEVEQKSTIIEEVEQKSTIKEEKEPKSTITEEVEQKSTIIEEKEPKSTLIEEKEPKSTILEVTQRESTNKETIEPGSTLEVHVEIKSTNLEQDKPNTTNVVETESTNEPEIEIKSTSQEYAQVESTNVEEVELKSTNKADIEIKSTTMKEIQIVSTITGEKEQISTNYNKKEEEESEEEKETEVEDEKQSEKEKESEEKKESQAEEEHQKEKEEKSEETKEEFESQKETQKETDKKEEETQKEEESEKEKESEKEDYSEKQNEKEQIKEQEKEEKPEKEQEKEKEVKPEKEKEKEKEKESEKEKETNSENTPEKEKETVKETSKEHKTYAPTNTPTTVQPETEKKEETDKKENTPKNITFSYRQINNFEQKDTSKIEFDLYALTMEEELSKGLQIPIYVNLIHTNGTRDEESTESICILNQDIKGNTASSLAYFRCSIENLEEIYYSFRYNYSNYIIGEPNDEIALDPILTKKSIEKNEIIDSSDESNLPPTFIIGSMIHENCEENGVLTFLGNISKLIDDNIAFTLALPNLEGTSLYCNLNGAEVKIECKTDRKIEGKTIEIAQTIIKEGTKEVLLLGSFMSEEQITCANAIYKESTEKSSITISFRQVSHFEKKSNGFSFYFTSLLSKEYKKGYNLDLKMDVEIKGKYTEKIANCILEKDAYPAAGSLVQGNFLCSVNLSPSEYSNTNFTTIKVSQANDKIGGISNLNEITENPYKTDLAIKEIKEKKAKNEYISEYADIVDYLEEEVKIHPVFNIDDIKESDTCGNTGKFILVGAVTDDITEDVKFDLPLTYPSDILKCEMFTSKKNDKIEITCKSSFGFKDVQNIVFEQRLITKKNKEIVIIPNKQINLNQVINCIDYNSAKIQLVKQRSNSGLFFLQVSKFTPLLNSFKFFIALTRRETKVAFKKNHELPVKLKFASKRFLRNLEEVVSGITAKCDINDELRTDYAAGYDCANSDSFSGTPHSLEIESNKIEDIEGIPDSANPDKLNYNIDYSQLQNLKNVDNLPTAELQNINADTCSENGEFNMTAILNKKGNLESKYSDVWITFAVPETRGLCEITIKDLNMSMICHNEENFYITRVFLERQAVQDSEGNEIFFIESFINPEQFACDISLNLFTTIKNATFEDNEMDSQYTDNANETLTDKPVENSNTFRSMFRKNSSRLSGGAIAAIVICLVIAIAIVLILIFLNKKGIRKKMVHDHTESSISKFVTKGNQNSINKI